MQGSIEHLQAGNSNGLGSYLSADIFNELSTYLAQSTDLKYFLLFVGIALVFIVMLILFRAKEQKNDEFVHIPVTEYSNDSITDIPEDEQPINSGFCNESLNKDLSDGSKEGIKVRNRNKNILESAFQPQWDLHNNSTEVQTDESNRFKITHKSSDPLNSLDEIRNVNQTTLDRRIRAFQELITDIQITDSQLMQEFENIRNNEKLDVFIGEFEQLLAQINSCTTTIVNSPEDLDNLIQFQSSIRFIKVLSEMVQAHCLNRYSYTVAEFLDGMIEGQIGMSPDTGKRLSKVVIFYNAYGRCLNLEKSVATDCNRLMH